MTTNNIFTLLDDKKTHIMVDLETLDTKGTAVIPSIGAARFNPLTGGILEKKQWNISNLKEQQAMGRTIDIDTIKWWMKQSNEAQEKTFNSKSKITLKEALKEFYNFCGAIPYGRIDDVDDVIIWGNGNMFDNAILRNAYDMYDLPYPCSFRNDLDLRTIKWLFKDSNILTPLIGTAHNAVDDAEYQVNVLCNCIKELIKGSGNE